MAWRWNLGWGRSRSLKWYSDGVRIKDTTIKAKDLIPRPRTWRQGQRVYKMDGFSNCYKQNKTWCKLQTCTMWAYFISTPWLKTRSTGADVAGTQNIFSNSEKAAYSTLWFATWGVCNKCYTDIITTIACSLIIQSNRAHWTHDIMFVMLQ